MNKLILALASLAAGLITASAAHAQAWPTKPIRIIHSTEVRERLVSQGAEVYTMTPTEFSSFFERERKQWASVVALGGVKLD